MCTRTTTTVRPNEEELEGMVRRTCAGDARAWHNLWLGVAPVVESTAGRFRALGRLARSADDRRDVVIRVMGELRRDDFRRLAEMGDLLARRDGSWRRWLSTIAINTARKHVRGHADYLGRVEEGRSRWVSYAELSEDEDGGGADLGGQVEVHRVLAWAREGISRAQYDALLPWLERASYAEIARDQGLAGGEAEAMRLVRSAVERLRYQFGVERGSAPGRRAPRPVAEGVEKIDR